MRDGPLGFNFVEELVDLTQFFAENAHGIENVERQFAKCISGRVDQHSERDTLFVHLGDVLGNRAQVCAYHIIHIVAHGVFAKVLFKKISREGAAVLEGLLVNGLEARARDLIKLAQCVVQVNDCLPLHLRCAVLTNVDLGFGDLGFAKAFRNVFACIDLGLFIHDSERKYIYYFHIEYSIFVKFTKNVKKRIYQ